MERKQFIYIWERERERDVAYEAMIKQDLQRTKNKSRNTKKIEWCKKNIGGKEKEAKTMMK